MPDKIAKIFALASKNLVLSMGKLFQFQIFTDFLKLHLFLDLDALCSSRAPLSTGMGNDHDNDEIVKKVPIKMLWRDPIRRGFTPFHF